METNSESTWQEWKAKAEALRVQLNLGAKEAADAFEEKKKDLGSWAKSTQVNLSAETSEKAKNLATKLDELQIQAALAKAEGKDAYAEQEKRFQSTYESVKQSLSEIAKSTSDEAKGLGKKAEAQLEDWEIQRDIFRVQMNLAGKEASDEWDKRKKQISDELEVLESKIASAKEDGGETWEKTKEDLASMWNSFKSNFNKS